MSTGVAPGAPGLGVGRRRREAADNFRLMADSAPVMIWVADPEGQGVYFNRPWLEFSGRPLASELGLGWAESLHLAATGHELNLSESYMTYWGWFEQIVAGEVSKGVVEEGLPDLPVRD